jgi:hypothetical protein
VLLGVQNLSTSGCPKGRPPSSSFYCHESHVGSARVSTTTQRSGRLAGLPAAPGTIYRLAGAVASGAGNRVAALVPLSARAAVTHAARAGTTSGLNDVLLAAAAIAALGAVAPFAFGPDPARTP